MENSIYTVDYFIKKFEPIPEERWASGAFTIGDAHCAQGHCGVTIFNSSDVWRIQGVNKEAEALIMLFQDYIPNGTGIQVAWINNGDHDNYKQPTPKQRILAALYDVYEKTYGRKYQAEPEPKVRDLSGIYFRAKSGDKWDNVCFEELTEEEQDKQLEGRSEEWLKSLAKKLAKTLNTIGEQFDLKSA